jgi:hypothetical protein
MKTKGQAEKSENFKQHPIAKIALSFSTMLFISKQIKSLFEISLLKELFLGISIVFVV